MFKSNLNNTVKAISILNKYFVWDSWFFWNHCNPGASSFEQAVSVVLNNLQNNKNFTQADFHNINVKDKTGKTVLHLAAMLNDQALTDKLLKCGINSLIEDNQGRTALHHARLEENSESIKSIVNYHLIITLF